MLKHNYIPLAKSLEIILDVVKEAMGAPVEISVETSLDSFPLDASSGSHFFHNVTAANVGYFSVQPSEGTGMINWKKPESIKPLEQTNYFKHLRFEKSLCVKNGWKKKNLYHRLGSKEQFQSLEIRLINKN